MRGGGGGDTPYMMTTTMTMTTTGKGRIQLREPAGAIAITYIVRWKDQGDVVGGDTGMMTNWDNF